MELFISIMRIVIWPIAIVVVLLLFRDIKPVKTSRAKDITDAIFVCLERDYLSRGFSLPGDPVSLNVFCKIDSKKIDSIEVNFKDSFEIIKGNPKWHGTQEQ